MDRDDRLGASPWRTIGGPGPAPFGPVDARIEGAPSEGSGGRTLVLVVAGVAATVLLAAAAYVVAATSGGAASFSVEGGALGAGADRGGEPTTPGASLVVDVGGAVLNPGLYRLAPGSRVGDAIEAAGGFGPRVDAQRASAELNLAALLADGERVRVPSRDDPTPVGPAPDGAGGTAGGGTGGAGGGLVDLNTATAAELDALPGIGTILAGRIIDARTEQPFRSVDELRERGILGPSTFAKVRDLVTVR